MIFVRPCETDCAAHVTPCENLGSPRKKASISPKIASRGLRPRPKIRCGNVPGRRKSCVHPSEGGCENHFCSALLVWAPLTGTVFWQCLLASFETGQNLARFRRFAKRLYPRIGQQPRRTHPHRHRSRQHAVRARSTTPACHLPRSLCPAAPRSGMPHLSSNHRPPWITQHHTTHICCHQQHLIFTDTHVCYPPPCSLRASQLGRSQRQADFGLLAAGYIRGRRRRNGS